jgi:hypothetical protein
LFALRSGDGGELSGRAHTLDRAGVKGRVRGAVEATGHSKLDFAVTDKIKHNRNLDSAVASFFRNKIFIRRLDRLVELENWVGGEGAGWLAATARGGNGVAIMWRGAT